MTKAQLIKILEPFDDDLLITVYDPIGEYKVTPELYYQFNKSMNEAEVVLAASKPQNLSKIVRIL